MAPETLEITHYLKQSAPVLVPLLLYFLRNETRLARIETHIQWIKKHINLGLPKVGDNPENGTTEKPL